jgi:hypothetical protein
MISKTLANAAKWTWDKLSGWLGDRRLVWRLAVLAIVLSSSALLLDFYLDDHIGRYIYSDREGAARLFRNYGGGYGLATGDPAENRWQMEAGWAPWWQDEHLRLILFRPVGVLLHQVDFRLLFDSPFLMHAHSLLWLGLMVVAVTVMYRQVLGPLLGGAAALLFTLDHTHGFAVGHICNRHALVATLFGALALAAHVRYRQRDRWRDAFPGPALYVLGLLTSEATVAIAGYVVAFELFAKEGAWRKRALAAAPYIAVTLVWRALYNAAGYGASGSGYYTDIGREPLRYLMAFLERAPLLLLGQFGAPPAEMYYGMPQSVAHVIFVWALIVAGIVLSAVLPLLRHDRIARFWAVGMLGALVPAASTDAHNRQLMLASLGAMGLLAQAWQFYATAVIDRAETWLRWARNFAALLLGFRLTVSPALLPLTTVEIALSTPMHTAAAKFGNEAAGRDAIFVTAPYEFVIRMVQLFKRIDGEPLPKHIRYIACGSQKTIITRTGPRTLEVGFEGGLLSKFELGLHRDPRLVMPPGTKVELEGFLVEVLATTEDAGPTLARFTFDKPLEDPGLAFYRWDERHFVPWTPPPIGARVVLPGALLPGGFE